MKSSSEPRPDVVEVVEDIQGVESPEIGRQPRRALAAAGRQMARRAPIALVVLAIAVDAVVLLRYARTMWFVGDDWDFLVRRNLHSVRAVLMPHNEHWSTIPIVAFRTMFKLYGVGSYLPYAVMPIVAHLVLCAALYAVLRRSAIGPYAAVLAVVAMLFIGGGAGGENTLWDFQIGFVGSAAFGVLALLLTTYGFRGARVLVVVCLVLGLMCSGMGLVMLVWVCAQVWFREGPARAFLVGLAPTVVYLSWYATYGHGYSGAPPAVPTVAPLAAVTGLGQVWSVGSGVPGAGAAILLVLVAGVLASTRRPAVAAVGMASLVGLVVMDVLIGYSRSGFGIRTMGSSRYIYFGVLLTAAPLAATIELALARLRRAVPWAAVASWGLVAALVASLGLAELHGIYGLRKHAALQARGRLAAGLMVADSGDRLLSNVPDRLRNPAVNLDNMSQVGLAQALRGIKVDALAILGARSSMQVAVSPTRTGLPGAGQLSWSGVTGVASGPAPLTACVSGVATRGAHIELAAVPPSGAEFSLSGSGFKLSTTLSDGGRTSIPTPWSVQPGSREWVASTATGLALRVLLSPGPVTVCPSGRR